jgi:hypothetical protein
MAAAVVMTALCMLLLTPTAWHGPSPATAQPAALSVRLLDEPPRVPSMPRPLPHAPLRQALSSPALSAFPLTVQPEAVPAAPEQASATPQTGLAKPAPLDLSAQAVGRAVQAVQPGWSLSERARSQHGLGAPSAGERFSSSVARSAKPECLKGHERSNLLDLPGKLLQALTDQCK